MLCNSALLPRVETSRSMLLYSSARKSFDSDAQVLEYELILSWLRCEKPQHFSEEVRPQLRRVGGLLFASGGLRSQPRGKECSNLQNSGQSATFFVHKSTVLYLGSSWE